MMLIIEHNYTTQTYGVPHFIEHSWHRLQYRSPFQVSNDIFYHVSVLFWLPRETIIYYWINAMQQ